MNKKVTDVLSNTIDGISNNDEKKETLGNAIKVILTKGHKSKTIIFSYLLIFFGVAQEVLLHTEAQVPPELYGILTSATGFATMALRYVTTQGLLEKGESEQ